MVLVLGLGLIVAIGVVDVLTGPDLSFPVFYLLPVFLTTFAAGRPAGIAVSTISAVVWLVADAASGAHPSLCCAPYWNASVGLGTVLAGTMLVSALVGPV